MASNPWKSRMMMIFSGAGRPLLPKNCHHSVQHDLAATTTVRDNRKILRLIADHYWDVSQPWFILRARPLLIEHHQLKLFCSMPAHTHTVKLYAFLGLYLTCSCCLASQPFCCWLARTMWFDCAEKWSSIKDPAQASLLSFTSWRLGANKKDWLLSERPLTN